jgi:ParB family chromosome partitioning protein
MAKRGTPEKAIDTPKTPSAQGTASQASYKEPRNTFPTEPRKEAAIAYAILPIKKLFSMPFQSRKDIQGPDFADLVESVKAVGVLEPILVRPRTSEDFEIVAGERRAAAAVDAGLVEVPAIVRILSDQEAYEIQLVENVHRKDLTDMEKARMLDMMIKKFGYTQEQLGKKLGKTQVWVSQHLAMLQIPESITRVIMNRTTEGELTERQAREILAAPEEKRGEILDKIKETIKETGKLPSGREIHAVAKSVPCARCGEAAEHPVNLEGKFYCANCAEQVVEEAKKGLIPEAHVGPFEEKHEGEPEVPSGPTEPEHAEKAVLKAVPIGTFQCTECNQHFIIEHLPNGKHKLKQIRSVEG